MAITFACEQCETIYRVPPHLAKQAALCRECEAPLVVPVESTVTPDDPASQFSGRSGVRPTSDAAAEPRKPNILGLLGGASLVASGFLPLVSAPSGESVSLVGLASGLPTLGLQPGPPMLVLSLLWIVPVLGIVALVREALAMRAGTHPRGTFFLAALVPLFVVGASVFSLANTEMTLIDTDDTGAKTLAKTVDDAIETEGGADLTTNAKIRVGLGIVKSALGLSGLALLLGVILCLVGVLLAPGGHGTPHVEGPLTGYS